MTERSRDTVGSRTEPDTNDLQPELIDEHWLLIADLFSNPTPNPQGGIKDIVGKWGFWFRGQIVGKFRIFPGLCPMKSSP